MMLGPDGFEKLWEICFQQIPRNMSNQQVLSSRSKESWILSYSECFEICSRGASFCIESPLQVKWCQALHPDEKCKEHTWFECFEAKSYMPYSFIEKGFVGRLFAFECAGAETQQIYRNFEDTPGPRPAMKHSSCKELNSVEPYVTDSRFVQCINKLDKHMPWPINTYQTCLQHIMKTYIIPSKNCKHALMRSYTYKHLYVWQTMKAINLSTTNRHHEAICTTDLPQLFEPVRA